MLEHDKGRAYRNLDEGELFVLNSGIDKHKADAMRFNLV